MKKNHFILLLISISLVAIIVFYNFTFIKPVRVVNEILQMSNENKLTYGLTQEQLNEINDFKESSIKYGFPQISFSKSIDWKLSKRFVMAKKMLWIKEHISTGQYILYLGENITGYHDVSAMVDYEEYDEKMLNGYTHIGSYNGSIYFRLKKTGFNKWEVESIKIYPVEP